MEGADYNSDGQLLTASYMDYCMPRADDLPSFKVDTIETPCPSNPLGIKGCGEAGAIASPPAVINAITDALGHEDVAMPATPQVVWRAAQKAVTEARRGMNRAGGGVGRLSAALFGDFMYAFEYHRPQRCPARSPPGERRQAARRRQTLLPTMKQRLASPSALIDLKSVAELSGIAREGEPRDRRHDAPRRGRATTPSCRRRFRRSPRSPAASATRTCATGARSAARSPTTIPPPTTRRRRSPWRDDRHQQARDPGGRFLQGPVRDRARGRRTHHQGALPDPAEGGLHEVPQSGLALRAGRRVRREDEGRRPRRGDRRRRERRLPRQRAGSRRSTRTSRRPRSMASPCPRAASTPISTPTRTIART